MELNKQLLPGYRLCDYMIVIDPGEDISEKVMKVREKFNADYKIQAVPWKPNLLLASFKQYSMAEERIANKLKVVAMGHYPFKVELKDYGSFPSHSIYIQITSKLPVQDLVRKVRSEAQALMKLGEEKPYFSMEPHMMIAKKLKPWQYEKGWLEYAQRHFTGRFIAAEMLLLKRYEGGKSWQVANHFKFENLPVEIKQGELF